MGAHSSLIITAWQARRIYCEHVCHNPAVSIEEMESLFDKALDEALYNVVIYQNDDTTEETSSGLVEHYVQKYMQANPHLRPETLATQNRILRELLAVRVTGAALYTDDGELQDASQHPVIDFRRDSAADLRRKLQERAMAQSDVARFKLMLKEFGLKFNSEIRDGHEAIDIIGTDQSDELGDGNRGYGATFVFDGETKKFRTLWTGVI